MSWQVDIIIVVISASVDALHARFNLEVKSVVLKLSRRASVSVDQPINMEHHAIMNMNHSWLLAKLCNGERKRQEGRQEGRQKGRKAGRKEGRKADRKAGRQAGRQTGRQTGRQAQRTWTLEAAAVAASTGFEHVGFGQIALLSTAPAGL